MIILRDQPGIRVFKIELELDPARATLQVT